MPTITRAQLDQIRATSPEAIQEVPAARPAITRAQLAQLMETDPDAVKINPVTVLGNDGFYKLLHAGRTPDQIEQIAKMRVTGQPAEMVDADAAAAQAMRESWLGPALDVPIAGDVMLGMGQAAQSVGGAAQQMAGYGDSMTRQAQAARRAGAVLNPGFPSEMTRGLTEGLTVAVPGMAAATYGAPVTAAAAGAGMFGATRGAEAYTESGGDPDFAAAQAMLGAIQGVIPAAPFTGTATRVIASGAGANVGISAIDEAIRYIKGQNASQSLSDLGKRFVIDAAMGAGMVVPQAHGAYLAKSAKLREQYASKAAREAEEVKLRAIQALQAKRDAPYRGTQPGLGFGIVPGGDSGPVARMPTPVGPDLQPLPDAIPAHSIYDRLGGGAGPGQILRTSTPMGGDLRPLPDAIPTGQNDVGYWMGPGMPGPETIVGGGRAPEPPTGLGMGLTGGVELQDPTPAGKIDPVSAMLGGRVQEAAEAAGATPEQAKMIATVAEAKGTVTKEDVRGITGKSREKAAPISKAVNQAAQAAETPQPAQADSLITQRGDRWIVGSRQYKSLQGAQMRAEQIRAEQARIQRIQDEFDALPEEEKQRKLDKEYRARLDQEEAYAAEQAKKQEAEELRLDGEYKAHRSEARAAVEEEAAKLGWVPWKHGRGWRGYDIPGGSEYIKLHNPETDDVIEVRVSDHAQPEQGGWQVRDSGEEGRMGPSDVSLVASPGEQWDLTPLRAKLSEIVAPTAPIAASPAGAETPQPPGPVSTPTPDATPDAPAPATPLAKKRVEQASKMFPGFTLKGKGRWEAPDGNQMVRNKDGSYTALDANDKPIAGTDKAPMTLVEAKQHAQDLVTQDQDAVPPPRGADPNNPERGAALNPVQAARDLPATFAADDAAAAQARADKAAWSATGAQQTKPVQTQAPKTPPAQPAPDVPPGPKGPASAATPKADDLSLSFTGASGLRVRVSWRPVQYDELPSALQWDVDADIKIAERHGGDKLHDLIDFKAGRTSKILETIDDGVRSDSRLQHPDDLEDSVARFALPGRFHDRKMSPAAERLAAKIQGKRNAEAARDLEARNSARQETDRAEAARAAYISEIAAMPMPKGRKDRVLISKDAEGVPLYADMTVYNGAWGIRASTEGKTTVYPVTHVQSGKSAGKYPTRRAAQDAIKAFIRAGIDTTDEASVLKSAQELKEIFQFFSGVRDHPPGYSPGGPKPPASADAFAPLVDMIPKGVRFAADAYERAKPHLEAAYRAAIQAGKTAADFVRDAVAALGAHVRPYAIRLMHELKRNEGMARNPFAGIVRPVKDTWRDATGDVVTGDTIRFTETVWGGTRNSPRSLGERTVTARILNDSYGKDKQQHTFTIEVLSSEGTQPLDAGTRTTRKGRNVYRNGVDRMEWQDEAQRITVADEKHARGGSARSVRDSRIMDESGAALNPVQAARELGRRAANAIKWNNDAPEAVWRSFDAGENFKQGTMMRANDLAARADAQHIDPIALKRYHEGDKTAAARFDPEQLATADAMRQHIDELQRLAAEVARTPKDRAIIENSVGEYMSRRYEIFDLRGKSQHKIDAWLKAREAMPEFEAVVRERMARGENRNQALANVRQELRQYTQKTGRASSTPVGRGDYGTMKERKDLSPEWRAIMGEIDTGMENYRRTADKLANMIAAGRMQRAIKEAGIAERWMAEEGSQDADMVKLSDNPSLGLMAGLWAKPETAKILEAGFRQRKQLEGAGAALAKATARWKFLQTAAEPYGFIRQIPTNFGMTAQMGVNPVNVREWMHAYRLAGVHAAHGTNIGTRRTDADFNELRGYAGMGVLDTETTTGSMYSGYRERGVADSIMDSRAVHVLGNIYSMADNAMKIYTARQLRKQYAPWFQSKSMSEEAIDRWIGERIKDELPTYRRNPKFIQAASDIPIVNPFIAYTYQTMRVQGNIVRNVMKDMKSGDPLLRAAAKRKLAAFVAANMAPIIAGTAMSPGGEEEAMVRESLPPWNRYNPGVISKNPGGDYNFANIGYAHMSPALLIPLMAAVNAPDDKKAIAGLKSAVDAFSDINPILDAAYGTAFGRDFKTGRELYDRRAPAGVKAEAVLANAWKTLQPAPFRRAERFAYMSQGQRSGGKETGAKLSNATEYGRLLGVPVDIAEPLRAIGFAARAWNQDWRSEYDRLIDGGASKWQAKRAIDARRKAEFKKVNQQIKAYRKASGSSMAAVRKSLMENGIAYGSANRLINGVYKPYAPKD